VARQTVWHIDAIAPIAVSLIVSQPEQAAGIILLCAALGIDIDLDRRTYVEVSRPPRSLAELYPAGYG